MSATIDERVVEMKFNNKDFEQNAKSSINTIDRLKQALNFESSSRGLDEIQNSVKRVDMKGLGDAVEGVKLKFSALQVAAVSALNNIVNKAVNAGTQIVKSFTLDPIMQGFNEYELKLGSIQTILANTQSQTGQVSQKAIQEVNTAAQEAAIKSEELNKQAIENLQKRNKAEVRALEKSQKEQTKALAKSQKNAMKALEERHRAELEKVQEAEEKKAEALAEAQSKQLEDLNNTYQKQLDAINEETKEEIDIIKKAHQQKLDMYNEEYMFKLKAADENRYNQIKAIEDEIESLKNLTKEEKKAKDEKAKQEKLDSLKSLRNKAETEDERKYVEKQISDYEAELEEERTQEARENRIDELEEKKKDINEAFNATKESLQEEYKENVEKENSVYQNEVESINKTQEYRLKAAQETYKKDLESLQKRQAAETKALQKKQKDEIEAINKRQDKESEALSDRQESERDALSERQQNERDALTERQNAEMTAISEQHKAVLSNIESEKTARLKALNAEAAKSKKPTNLKDVNDALAELNTYADKTIYNFADMTKNIGTFTAAGVDLDTSVDAIKGIANLAAVSGSNSQQASTAMYQLSQAIATGTVKLMDWNSVVNAGMGGKTFQNSLIETAKVHGVAIDEIISKNGSFRDSLQEGWLTSDILLETLSKFTGDLTEEQLKSMGYTEEQIADIIKMGNTAVDAATKVRSWTQLLDTTKEAMGSGWAETWEIVFGNFEEATDLWTGFSDFVSGIIDKQSDARNAMLKSWKVYGGRNAAIETAVNLWKALESIIVPIQKAFREIFPKTTGKQLADMTKSLRDVTSKLKLSDTASENLKNTFSGLFSIVSLVGKGFLAAFDILKPGIKVVSNLAGAILDVTGKLGAWITQINKTVSKDEGLSKVFESIKSMIGSAFDSLDNFIDYIRKFVNSKFKMPDVSFISKFSESMSNGTKPLEFFLNLIKTGFSEASKVLSKVAPVFKTLVKPITDLFKGGMGLKDAVDIFAKGTLTVAISKFILNLSSLMKSAKKAFEPLKDIAKDIGDVFGAIQNQINAKTLKNVAVAIAILVGSLFLLSTINEDKLATSLLAITGLFIELVTVFEELQDADASKVTGVSKTLLAMSASVLILAMAMKQIAGADVDKMTVAAIAVGALMYEMSKIAESLDEKKSKEFKSKAVSLIGMGASVLLLAKAIKQLAGLNTAEIIQGGLAVAAAMGLISLVSKASEKGGFKFTNGVGIIALAASMFVFQKAIEGFASMDVEQLKKGGIALASLIGVLALFESIAGVAEHGFGSSAGTLLVAVSLLVLLKPLKELGKLNFNVLTQGLASIGIALAEFAVTARLMDGTKDSALAIIAMTGALLVLTPVIKILGSMNIIEIGTALIALAGAFTVMGVAAKVMKNAKLISSLNELAKAVAILGVGMLGIGAGVAAFAVGLTTLAGAGAAAVASLVLIVKSLIVGVLEAISENLPLIITNLKNFVLSALQGLVEIIPEAANSIYTIITSIIASMGQFIPNIIEQLMTFLTNVIDALSDNLPELVKAVVTLFVTFFASIIEALKDLDTQTLEDALLGVGLFSSILIAFAGFSAIAAPAMQGVVALAGVIAELTALIAAAGAIAQIPGFTWLIGEGGELLQGVGNAIGKFVGGIIGGFAEGISSSFPQIATDLSKFMTNLKPFIDGTKDVDAEAISAVGSVVDMILKLTAVDLLDGIKRFFTSGKSGISFSGFADELVNFGPKVKQFSDSVKGIDTGAVTAAATAASIMNVVATNLPKTGGFWQDIVGTPKTLETFGEELESFGPSIKAFSDSVAGGIDETAVTAAANAAKIMNEVAKNLPSTGGYWQKLFGEKLSLSDFGEDLESFGPSIKAFSDSVAGGIDETAVTSAKNAGSALAELANSLPPSGGFLQDFFGEQNLETFGKQIEEFGKSMKAYSDAITDGDGFNAEAVTASTNAGLALAGLADALPDEAGAFAFFTGESDLESFGGQLKSFGEAFKGYYDSISGINTVKMASVVTAIKDMVAIANDTKDLDTSGLKNFGKNLKKMGENGIEKLVSAFENSQEDMTNAINTMIGFIKTAITEGKTGVYDESKNAGDEAGKGLQKGIESNRNSIITATNNIADTIIKTLRKGLPKETIKQIGSDAISYVINGIKAKYDSIEVTCENVGLRIVKTINSALSYKTLYSIGASIVTSIGTAINNNKYSRGSAVTAANNLAVSAYNSITSTLNYNNAYIIGQNIGTGLYDGMSSKNPIVASAGRGLALAARNAATSTLAIRSPSKVFKKIGENVGDGFVIGISDTISAVSKAGTNLGNSAVSPVKLAIQEIEDVTSSMDDFSPTITPYVDLTNVNASIDEISSKFNGLQPDTSSALADNASSAYRQSEIAARERDSTIQNQKMANAIDTLLNKIDKLGEQIYASQGRNVFNISSSDPKKAADEVGNILQRQVERRKAAWGK